MSVKRWYYSAEQREFIDDEGDECVCSAVVNARDFDAACAERDRWREQAIDRVADWRKCEQQRDALAAERDAAKRELFVVAEAIWQNVNREEMKHWAQGIRVSVLGPNAVKITDTERTALAARVERLEGLLRTADDALSHCGKYHDDEPRLSIRAALSPQAEKLEKEDVDAVRRGAK